MDWTHRLRLRNLEMLLSLAHTGNLSHTAEEMHTTQPGLSKWLKELEDDLGLPLFERGTRGVRPTMYGEAFIAHARRIVSHLVKARDDMEVMRKGGSGIVTIGIAGASSVDTIVPMAVLKVLERIPTVHVRIEENTVETLRERLRSGHLDLVVGRTGIDFLDADIRAEVLYVEPIDMVVRLGHPLLELENPTWADVKSYPWALWSRGTPVRTAFDIAMAQAGQHFPPNFVESNSPNLTTTLLRDSDMVGIAAHRAALRLNRMNILGLIKLPLPVVGSVTMYWREDAMDRAAVAAALDGLRQAVEGTLKQEAEQAAPRANDHATARSRSRAGRT